MVSPVFHHPLTVICFLCYSSHAENLFRGLFPVRFSLPQWFSVFVLFSYLCIVPQQNRAANSGIVRAELPPEPSVAHPAVSILKFVDDTTFPLDMQMPQWLNCPAPSAVTNDDSRVISFNTLMVIGMDRINVATSDIGWLN